MEAWGSCHSSCGNKKAIVKGHLHGIKKGWFSWPNNYDPVWLLECDGFDESKPENR
jgi:hypothetical protein